MSVPADKTQYLIEENDVYTISNVIERAIDDLKNAKDNEEKERIEKIVLEIIHDPEYWKTLKDSPKRLTALATWVLQNGQPNILKALIREGSPNHLHHFIFNDSWIQGLSLIENAIVWHELECLKILVKPQDINKPSFNSEKEIEEQFERVFCDENEFYQRVTRGLWKYPVEFCLQYSRDPVSILKLFMEVNKNFINEPNCDNQLTPLMYSLKEGNFAVALWLLQQPHIDVNVKNDMGENAYTYFMKANGRAIIESRNANPDKKQDNECENIKRQVLDLLDKKGIDADKRMGENWAAMVPGLILHINNQKASADKKIEHEHSKLIAS